MRGGLQNARIRFARDKRGCVAFIGGSITEMDGYRPMVCKGLQDRFGDTKFTFIDAGIASTCSTTGAFRLVTDVLGKGPVDLLFVEFAVNDDQDAGHAARECIRGMEGLVRHARLANPKIDIVITYFVNPSMLADLQAGKTPVPVAAHEKVAAHYGVSTIHLAQEVATRIAAGEFDWKAFGGTHPAPFGNRIAAKMIDDLLSAAWARSLPADAKPADYPLPDRPLDQKSYLRGRFIDVKTAAVKDGWTVAVPPWTKLKGGCRTRFREVELLAADRPGAEMGLDFEGTAIGAYVLAGPDAGVVEASIDGGPAKTIDLYHHFSGGLHYPRTVLFDADLKEGPHRLTLRVAPRKAGTKGGTAARVLHFVAN